MPEATDIVDDNTNLLRILLYGPSKCRKTTWALKAVEAGFNLVFLRGEDNLQVIRQIPRNLLHKIKIIDIREPLGGASLCYFMTEFLSAKDFVWNETTKTKYISGIAAEADGNYVQVRPRLLGPNDILVLDTWTAYVQSMDRQFAGINHINLADAAKKDWEGYGWTGRLADWSISQLKALPCHVLVVAHQQTYEKKSSIRDGKGGWLTHTEWTRIQPVSTSSASSQRLAKDFTDVFLFYLVGEQVKIETGPKQDRDGGSTNVPPGTHNWEKFQFLDLFTTSGIRKPDPEADCKAVKFARTPKDFNVSSIPATNTPLQGNAAPAKFNQPIAAKPGPLNLTSLMAGNNGERA